METGGIFVCKTKQVALVGAKPVDHSPAEDFDMLRSPRHSGAATPARSSSNDSMGARSVMGGQTPGPQGNDL